LVKTSPPEASTSYVKPVFLLGTELYLEENMVLVPGSSALHHIRGLLKMLAHDKVEMLRRVTVRATILDLTPALEASITRHMLKMRRNNTLLIKD
jgi:hypothetical protein